MIWKRTVDDRRQMVAFTTAAVLALALAALAAPVASEGLPVIDFISTGGVVSEEYVLNVTVIGDLAPGQVFYGLDGADPVTAMTAKPLYHYEAVIDTSGMAEGDHTVTVKAINTTGDNVTRTQTITVDHTDPVVTITSSVPEYVIGEYTVTATVDDANVDASGVRLVIDGNMSLSWPMEDEGSHFELVLDTAVELMCGPHTLSVYAIDKGGNGAWSDDVEVDVDNCKPMVMFTSGGGHVTGIYHLSVNVTDAYMDPGKVWAVFDGDTLNKTALNDQGDGVYTYSFDTTNMMDGDTEITILATDLVGYTREAGPLVLQVDNNAPVSVITSGGGDVSGVVTVEATVTDAYLNETAVYLVLDGDDDNSTMMTPVDGRGHYELRIDTEEWMDGNREVRVWAEDMWGMSARSPAVYMDIDNHEPVIRFVSGGGTRWGNYQVRANVTDPNLNTSCVKVKVAGGEPMQMKASEEYWYLDINTRNYPDGQLELMVMACDTKGHMNMGVMMMIMVANQADLEIIIVEWASTDVELGEMARVKVSVKNNGHTTVKGYTVVASSGGSELATMTESTGIQPGKVHSYTLEWKTKSTGEQYVRLEVDPGNAVSESDETNNHYEQQVISVTEGGSGVPGMGAMLAVAAVLAVFVALLGREER
jgi:hypothetical protein